MADVQFENFALASSQHFFSAVWKWTRALKKAGWVYLSSADGTSKDTTGTAANDKWGGSVDPASDTYPAALDTVNAWWNAQGPTTLQLSISSAPTGTFIPGEKVTQATSGAEGEFHGFDFDGVSQGHAVIIPRTGTFDATHVVTGAVSGASFTPTALGTFVREIVIFKSTDKVNGSLYFQTVHNETENANRFSVLATSAGCTATVAPGAGGTGNAFPSIGWVWAGSQTGTPAHTFWVQNPSDGTGTAQIIATNCIGATGVSPDGTAWMSVGNPTYTASAFFGFFRCDDCEPADVDPFLTWHNTTTISTNASVRLTAIGAAMNGTNDFFPANNGGEACWRGWRRRGFPSNDAFNSWTPALPAFLEGGASGGNTIIGDTIATPETIANAYTTKKVREKLYMVSQTPTAKGRKGTLRWLSLAQGAASYDTFDSKQKIVLQGTTVGAATSSGLTGSIIGGPADGATAPTP